MLSFQKTRIGALELRNRIVMAPMCMNSADEEGHVRNFHVIHYGNAAIGGLGLILVEATAVTPEGRILGHDLGIWNDSHLPGHQKIVEVAHEFGAKIGIQLAHAGRKCAIPGMEILAPSAIAFDETYEVPTALDQAGISRIRAAFTDGARRAVEAGYDLIEIHAAHGYLLHEFLSPLSNHRTDEYGGSRENRARLLMEVIGDIRKVIPREMPLIVRISATDYYEGGIDLEEMVELVNLFKPLIDMVHVSSGALVAQAKVSSYPGYQVPLSEAIRSRCGVPTIAVGLITKMEQIEEILNSGRADLVSLGRVLLRHPYFLLNKAEDEVEIPYAIQRGFPFLRKRK
ncbi:MAG: NADH:flavin oxidoreductase/NADH oxidase [Clostridiaceae bacterium]